MTDDTAADLDLAVELINTVYRLGDPPDRLADIEHFRRIMGGLGHGDLAAQLSENDLEPLRDLRERLRNVFLVRSGAEAGPLLNDLLWQSHAMPQLQPRPDGTLTLRFDSTVTGLRAVAARMSMALARHVAANGLGRLGVCQAAPCDCVFVDRTRAANRRYCCDGCNDRAAAAAYRRRRSRPSA